jgi:coiled-coil domain-containing protein 130
MQGFNMGRYVPPDQEGVTSGNALHKKHPLGSRASKLASQGVLTVRFEMPFAVWCTHCPQPTIIGQGVRFNAEKRKVGNYHSTPIWAFRMRHGVCSGAIELQTDPANTAYVVVSGAKKRDTGDDKDDSLVKTTGDGRPIGPITTDAERAAQRESAFGKLEKTIADRERLVDATRRIDELHDVAARQWEDPYTRNQRLRESFRVGRHAREKETAAADALRDRMSLGIELLPGTDEDDRRAALVDFGGVDDMTTTTGRDTLVDKALARPLFEAVASRGGDSDDKYGQGDSDAAATGLRKRGKGKLKSEMAASSTRKALVTEIVGNTRAAKDPFLDFGAKDTAKLPTRFPGVKRKRESEDVLDPPEEITPKALATRTLVGYASDSD